MIQKLSIRNFKSIKQLEISDCRRINVFIGEFNSGKSNILEALSLMSVNSFNQDVFNEIFRFKNITDFFYDSNTSNNIEIKTDKLCFQLKLGQTSQGNLLNYFEAFIYAAQTESELKDFSLNKLSDHNDVFISNVEFDGKIRLIKPGNLPTLFRTYNFKRLKNFNKHYLNILNPPFGDNIPSLLISNKKLKDLVSSIIRSKGFRLMLKPTESDLSIAKDVNDELYSYPYNTISETLQRIIFYTLAIETNKDATIIMDEPDSNTFPMYTKQIAELIANDKSNQYFIATHNPYLLGSLVSKTPEKEIAVIVTSMNEYQTTVSQVSQQKLSTLLDSGIDVFFNLDLLTLNEEENNN